MTTIPEWADPELSATLPTLRAQGEGQSMDYMAAFPSNARELGKEIAAFATSNAGTILLGVDDEGTLVGLRNADTPSARDQLHQRLQGICHGTIKPALTPIVRFAVEDEQVVLVIQIAKGSDPVYYSNNTPYLRHITEARPAEPAEVVDLVRTWLSTEPSPAPIPSAIATAATRAELFIHDLDSFRVKPGLDRLQSEFAAIADDLRAAALTDNALDSGLSHDLQAAAQAADGVAHFQLFIGSSEKFAQAVATVAQVVEALYAKHVASSTSPRKDVLAAKNQLRLYTREIADLTGRASALLSSGQTTDLMIKLELLSFYIMGLAFGPLRSETDAYLQSLRITARKIHALTATRFQVDGGESERLFLDALRAATKDLELLEAGIIPAAAG